MNDIFEKIIAREIPAEIVYEDDDVIAFLDIKPVNKGHALVVPKRHFRNLLDGEEALLGRMIAAAKLVANGIKDATGADGINLVMNNEEAAGQEIFHAHLHVIPRMYDDNAFPAHRHTSYADGEINELGTKIKNAIG